MYFLLLVGGNLQFIGASSESGMCCSSDKGSGGWSTNGCYAAACKLQQESSRALCYACHMHATHLVSPRCRNADSVSGLAMSSSPWSFSCCHCPPAKRHQADTQQCCSNARASQPTSPAAYACSKCCMTLSSFAAAHRLCQAAAARLAAAAAANPPPHQAEPTAP